MSKIRLAGISAVALVAFCGTLAHAVDIAGKVILVKDNANPAKRFIKVLSLDPAVTLLSADDPITNGAALHVYSATDDYCAILPADGNWQNLGTKIKYKNTTTKNTALVKDGRLLLKIKSGSTFTLNPPPQGAVNVQVQFGTGTRFCMRCTTPVKDDTKKFLARNCTAAPCAAEPSVCDTAPSTSTTSTSTTSTTSTTAEPGTELQGVLPATTGRFNYNLTLGIPGADAACATNFPGTHACTYAELLIAEGAGDLVGITDTTAATVTSFWAIDNAQPAGLQCIDDTIGGSFQNWEYATAHTGTFAQKVNLTNGTGDLGPLLSGAGDGAVCAAASWVGCCL
jgi:hypothetical protein